MSRGFVDELETRQWCRDEACPIEELHEAHAPIPLRGRTPKACPRCLASLIDECGVSTGVCSACGWSRSGEIVEVEPEAEGEPLDIEPPSTSPWVACPWCRGKGCDSFCGRLGFVPRLRAMYMRQTMEMPKR